MGGVVRLPKETDLCLENGNLFWKKYGVMFWGWHFKHLSRMAALASHHVSCCISGASCCVISFLWLVKNSRMTKCRKGSEKCDCMLWKRENINLKDKECCLKCLKHKCNLLSSGKCSKGWGEQYLLTINLCFFFLLVCVCVCYPPMTCKKSEMGGVGNIFFFFSSCLWLGFRYQ